MHNICKRFWKEHFGPRLHEEEETKYKYYMTRWLMISLMPVDQYFSKFKVCLDLSTLHSKTLNEWDELPTGTSWIYSKTYI